MTAGQKPPQAAGALVEIGLRAAGGGYLRSAPGTRSARSSTGLQLVPPHAGTDPDITRVGLWNCDDAVLADSDGSRWLYCGVAEKTS